MKILFSAIFLISLLFISCENGVIMSFNPDDVGNVSFIKSEKVALDGKSLNCEYNSQSHKHSQNDSYYIYFTMRSKNDSPVNPYSPKFAGIEDSISVNIQSKVQNGYADDKDIQVGKVEYLDFGKNLSKWQNWTILMDLSEHKTCVDDNLDMCSLSGGLTGIQFADLISKIKTSLENLEKSFLNPKSYYPEDKFLGVNYFLFSVNEGENWFKEAAGIYYNDLKNIFKTFDESLATKQESSQYHRKLFDGFIEAAEKLKGYTNAENKNLLLFTAGYDESYYDTENKLSDANKSSHSEDDFFNAITSSDNIPVFIAPQKHADKRSFPDEKEEEIDNKFYKLACLTNGAYFPFVGDVLGNWNETGINDYNSSSIMGKIKDASYGMWRVKVTLKHTSQDRYFDGKIIVKTKGAKGDDITVEDYFRIVR